jgi:uncharacterized protein YaaQ
MVIAPPDDANSLAEGLTQADFRATRLDSAGGFLRQGNATMLIAVEGEDVGEVLRIVQETCHPRTAVSPSMMPGRGSTEVKVSGASVFVMDISRFEKL